MKFLLKLSHGTNLGKNKICIFYFKPHTPRIQVLHEKFSIKYYYYYNNNIIIIIYNNNNNNNNIIIIIYNNNNNNNNNNNSNNNNGISGSISTEWLFACPMLTKKSTCSWKIAQLITS